MAKAWMPFYIADYLADTGHLTAEEHGVFVLSLFHYWQTNQPLTANAGQLQMICRCMDAARFEQVWSVVSQFYVMDNGVWRNIRMDKELLKAHRLSETRAAAANKRYEKKPAKAPAIALQKQTQSQSQKDKPLYTDAFMSFWEAYPKKIGKGAAFVSWKKSGCEKLNGEITAAVEAQKKCQQWQKENGQFIPNPQTWLNQRRWEDESTPETNETPSWMQGG